MHRATLVGLALTALGAAMAAPPAPAADLYRIKQAVPLGAPDGWDYVVADSATHRVYVAHGDHLTIVDAAHGTVLGQVAGFPGGTHGTAVATDLGRGYTDDGRAGEAGGFDLTTFKPTKHVKVEEDADAMAYDPVSHHVFVMSGGGTVSVIDPRKDDAVTNINVGGGLEYAAVDGAGKLYVNGASKQEIIRIDTATNTVTARWPVPDCQRPHGMAIDAKHHRLFTSCVNSVLQVINTDKGTVVATVPIGQGTDAAGFDPVRGRVFSSNGRDGTITVIQEKDPDTYVPLGVVTTAVSARTMDVDASTGSLYVVAADIAKTDAPPQANGRPARPSYVPGSTRLLILEPLP